MALFRYMAMGDGPEGTIEAPDRASAVRALLQQGVTPRRVEPVSASGQVERRGARAVSRGGSRMSRAEFSTFVRELATALSAGLPLVQALQTMQRGARKGGQRRMLAHLIDRVEHGRSLAEAAREWGRPFDDLTISLIVAGEASGRLDEVLRHAAGLLEQDVRLRRAVASATLYPLILAVLISAAVVVLVTFIVPSILEPLRGQLVELPWPTRVVQGVAFAVGHFWWLIVAALGGVVLLARWMLRAPQIRLAIDRALLRLPLLGRLVRELATARFARTLGTLTGAGIPALGALRITKGTLGNKAMERIVEDICEQVSAGRTIAEPMEASGLFPAMLVQIVHLGERSGRLDETLAQAAGAFEERTQATLKLLLTALPPALVVMLAGVVGFVVLAILLPLLDVQEAML